MKGATVDDVSAGPSRESLATTRSGVEFGVAIATQASVGQRSLEIEAEKAPAGMAAVIVIRPRHGGGWLKYSIPAAALSDLAKMNRELDPRARHDPVMKADGLFESQAVPF
jgi:hypothetical protein